MESSCHVNRFPNQLVHPLTPPLDHVECSPVNGLKLQIPPPILNTTQEQALNTPEKNPRGKNKSVSGRTSNQQPNSRNNQPPANPDIIFSPRTYEAIHNERAYLSYSFQNQSHQAATLIQQYATVQASLCQGETGKSRRRLRKQLSLIKSRLHGVERQEQVLSLRLAQVSQELQYRELWHRANMEIAFEVVQASGNNPVLPRPSPGVYLNPVSPEFVSRDLGLWGSETKVVDTGSDLDTVPEDEDVDDMQCVHHQDFTTCNHGLKYEYRHDEIEPETEPELDYRTILANKGRRHSLPNIGSIWPGCG